VGRRPSGAAGGKMPEREGHLWAHRRRTTRGRWGGNAAAPALDRARCTRGAPRDAAALRAFNSTLEYDILNSQKKSMMILNCIRPHAIGWSATSPIHNRV
jgi:hypothetical protein